MRSMLMGGVSRFAHLAGIELGVSSRGVRAEDDSDDDQARRSRSSRAEDDDEDKKDDKEGRRSRAEDDDDKDDKEGRRSRAEDDDEDKKDDKEGRRSRAEDDDDKDDKEGRRSRRSSLAENDEDEDDDKDEMSGRSSAASARKRERARCAAIFGSSYAAGNVELAASLAFETTMTRKEAVAVLRSQAGRAAPASAHDVRGDRRDRNPRLGPGGDASPTGPQATAAVWDRALAKAGVATPAK